MQPAIPLLFLLLSLSVQVREGRKDGSLYDVLGVSRDANQKEIRSAYKRLARQWHPDKNKSPEAQEKILEINKAYEVLSGEQSRRRYDMTGETDPAPSGSQSHTHNSHGFTFFHARNGFFQHSQLREDTITTRYFKNTVLPESNSRLWLLYFYGDFCIQCGEVSRIWDELKAEMKSSGVAMASVHNSRQYIIASHCNVDRIPAVVAVMNGRVFHYSGHWQARNIWNFVENTLPSWTISEGVLSRIWDGVTERFYDFAKANSHVRTLWNMIAPIIFICGTMRCVDILRATHTHMAKGPMRRPQGRRKPPHHRSTNDDPGSPLIPEFNTQLYQQHIIQGDRGSVVILILINSVARKNMLFISEILERHRRQKVFFFCGALDSHCSWLSKLLEGSSMDPGEVERRKKWYFSETEHSRPCALAILPAKKKFAIFPESLADMSSNRGDIMSKSSPILSDESSANESDVRDGFEEDATASHEEKGEMESGLSVWMERLEDGSLKRYSTMSWAKWQ